MRHSKRLTAAEVKSLDAGKYADGDGLWLVKRHDGGAQWTFRFTLWGRPREMGLGSLRHVSLREARLLAEEVRKQVRDGIDPIKARRIEQGKLRRVESTLGAIAEAAYEVHRKTLKHNGEDGKWFSPLRLYILPRLGKMPIAKIDQHDLKDVLQNIWHERHESARKALSRLAIVYQHAVALNHDVDLQIIEKTKILLGKPAPQNRNIPAMDWSEVPSFYGTLVDTSAVELALRMLILTGVRSAPVRYMKFEQIEGSVWTIPAENVKGRRGQAKLFEVPLSDEALHVLELARSMVSGEFVFSTSDRKPIGPMSMRNLMMERNLTARPHGFRTSLRTWLSEETHIQREVAETILQHAVGSEVERAYNRTSYLEKRREPMEAWARFVTGKTGKS